MDFKQFMKNVKNEASDAVEVTKIKAKISKEKSTVKDTFEEIGKLMYETYRKSGVMPEEYKEQITKVDEARAKINEYNKEIENVIASVDFSENLYYNKRYFVFPQLTSDGGGSIGEYSSILREKDRNGFKFDISGNASYYTMDWITIDNVPFPTYEDIHGIEKQLHERDEKLILQEEKLTKLENLVAELGNKVQAIEDRDNL